MAQDGSLGLLVVLSKSVLDLTLRWCDSKKSDEGLCRCLGDGWVSNW